MVRIRIGGDEIAVPWDDWEDRVRAGRVPADAQVCIPALTGDRFVAASSLESWQSLRHLDEEAFRRAIVGGGPPVVTALLVGLQFRLWWLLWIPGVQAPVVSALSCWAPMVLENGQSWRLVTMGLLHVDFDHIALNMVWLAYTGWSIESALGKTNLVAIFLASVVAGAVLSETMSPWHASLGASGGVMGLVAACIVFGLTRPELLPEVSRRTYGFALIPYVLGIFWTGLQSEGTDNWAHFGGLIVGGGLALVLDPESLPRRPRWNTGVRGLTGAMLALALAFPVVIGPRLVRTSTDEVAAWEALRRRDPEVPPPDPVTYRSVDWQVPAGWERGRTLAGDGAFCSPAGDRCFSVEERRRTAPMDLDALAQDWLAGVQRAFGDDAVVAAPEAVEVGGWPGRRLVVSVPKGRVEWLGAVRGRYTLQVVWQVEPASEARLASLRDRLVSGVVWRDPSPLADAKRNLGIAPESRAARLEYARMRADVGEQAEAATELGALIAEAPGIEDPWLALVELAAEDASVVEDRRRLWADALAANPTPSVVVALASAIERGGEIATARGLLDVAWVAHPGDRSLKRARKSRGLAVALDAASNLPYDAVVDVLTGEPRPEADVARWVAAPVDLPNAEARGRELDARDAAIAAALRDAAPDAFVAILLRVKDGPASADAAAALAGLREDLKSTSRGYAPPWLPSPLKEVVAGRLIDDPVISALLP